MLSYLHSHQDLILLRAEVVALCQENFPEGSFSKLPLQNDIVSLDVLDNWKTKTPVTQQSPRGLPHGVMAISLPPAVSRWSMEELQCPHLWRA